LSAIKGVGSGAIEQIVENRNEKGEFRSIFDFASRIDTRVCNKKTIESLAQAGAFDTLHQNRAQLLASIEDIISYASRKQEEERLNQVSLFGDGSSGSGFVQEPKLRDCPPWTNIERLNKERELIGFYLSGHPLDRYKEDAKLFASHTLATDELSELNDRDRVKVVAIITAVKRITDKKGRPMAFVQVEDLQGSVEVLVFSEVYDRHQGLIAPDTVILIEGTVSLRDSQPKIIANSLERVENLREKFQSQLQLNIKLDTSEISENDLQEMAALFGGNLGETPVKLQVKSEYSSKPITMNVRKYVVDPSNDLLKRLRNVVGDESVHLINNKQQAI